MVNTKLYCFLAAVLLAAAGAANATYTVNIAQNGSDVVMTGSGSIDTTGMATNPGNIPCNLAGVGAVGPAVVCIGSGNAGLSAMGVVTPFLANLTSGNSTDASSATGSPVIVSNGDLYLPAGYISGQAITSSSTFTGQSFASLGLTPGSSTTLNLSSGDTVVINVANAPASTSASVPTLTEYAMVTLSFLMAAAGAYSMRRKRM